MKLEQEAQLDALRAQYEDQRHVREMEFQRWKAELDASVRVTTANMARQMPMNDPATIAAEGEISREVQP